MYSILINENRTNREARISALRTERDCIVEKTRSRRDKIIDDARRMRDEEKSISWDCGTSISIDVSESFIPALRRRGFLVLSIREEK